MPSPAAAPNLVNLLGQEAQLHDTGEYTFVGSDLTVRKRPDETYELKLSPNSSVVFYRLNPETLTSQRQDGVLVNPARFDLPRLLADFLSAEAAAKDGQLDLSKAGFGVIEGYGKDARPQIHLDAYRMAVDTEELRTALHTLIAYLKSPPEARKQGISFSDKVRDKTNSHIDLAETLLLCLPNENKVTAETLVQACHGRPGNSPSGKLLESLLNVLGELVPRDLYMKTLKIYREPVRPL